MQAMIRTAPPHSRQVSMSIPKTRFRRCAQVIAARRSLGVGSSCWFCLCHRSVYDMGGRVRHGPAPRNLDVPPYKFLDKTRVRIG